MPHATPSREYLLHLLAEAAELEHNLLCSYLFALFSLKTDPGEDLQAAEFDAVQRWRKALLGVCVEEMTHLAQVANLTTALGWRPHFNRPNLPVAAGYHPAGVVVELTRFDLDTLEHFIHLERPEGLRVPDGPSFVPEQSYARRPHNGDLMPSAPDYKTIGEFYDVLRRGLQAHAATLGQERLFMGPRDVQLRPEEAGAQTLIVIRDLRSACDAVDEIVRQGEGAPGDTEASHFATFRAIKAEYVDLLWRRPAFEPSRRVGRNPVMRFAVAAARTHVTHPDASAVLDAANGLYSLMLRCLAQCYETPWTDTQARAAIVGATFRTMRAFAGVASDLTEMSARADGNDERAGVSFSMMRNTEGPARGAGGWLALSERLREIRACVPALPLPDRALHRVEVDLARVAESLGAGADEAPGDVRSASVRSSSAPGPAAIRAVLDHEA